MRTGAGSAQSQDRKCRSCGTRLAADNGANICSPCGRTARATEDAAPAMPDAFWDLPGMRDALVQRDFGRVLRAYRSAGGVEFTQARVARWLGLTQAQVSRLERGARSATDLSKLDRWAQSLRIPQRCLWFALSQPPEEYSRPQRTPSLPATTVSEGEDVRRRDFLKTTGAAAGGSLLSDGSTPASVSAERSSVGMRDVAQMREMTVTFRRLDNRYGGCHGRSAVASYLVRLLSNYLAMFEAPPISETAFIVAPQNSIN